MLEWYLEVNALFRAMRQKAIDAQGLLASDDKAGAKLIKPEHFPAAFDVT